MHRGGVANVTVRHSPARWPVPNQALARCGHWIEVGVAKPAGEHQHEHAGENQEDRTAVTAALDNGLLLHVVRLSRLVNTAYARRRSRSARARRPRRRRHHRTVGAILIGRAMMFKLFVHTMFAFGV